MADSYYKIPVTITVQVITKAADVNAATTQALDYVQRKRVAKMTVHDEQVAYAAGTPQVLS